ncbi:MAG: methyl-accepting chemotaxis protein [Piscirickettsiaceae bacterium]|nr:methyl-accepting chemotaxis protein [Piscirickettsiaceae bacterium]
MKKQLLQILLSLSMIPALLLAIVLVALMSYHSKTTIQIDDILFWSAITLLILGALSYGILVKILIPMFMDPLNYVIGSLQFIAKDIEKGDVDLTQPLNPPGNNKLANAMAKGVNMMLQQFSAVLVEFAQATSSISTSSSQVNNLSAESSQNMMVQRTETDQVATAITELAASAEEVARNAHMGAEAAKNADAETQAGSVIVSEAASTIQDLSASLANASTVIHGLEEDSSAIGSVLAVIQGIAEQTNLLALNAAIEAARAGEQGRGFAVVADEVRTLAGRTQDATLEIKTIIEQLQSRSSEAVKVMEDGCGKANIGLEKATAAGVALSAIAEKVAEIDNMNALISSAAQEQSAVAEEVNQSVVRISQLTDQTTEGASQTAQASSELLSLATRLNDLASQFKT